MHSFKILMDSKTYMLTTSSLKSLVKNHLKYTFIYLFILSYDLLYLNLEKNARDSLDRTNSQSVLSLTVKDASQERRKEDQMNTFSNIN